MNMNEHTQTIREALEESRYRAELAIDGWKETSATYKRYDAEITRIDAALAAIDAQPTTQGWQPLPDGEVTAFSYVDNGGKLLSVFAGDDYSDWYATEELPDDIRLCRLQAQPLPQPPMPDDVREAIEVALYFLRSSDRTEMHGNQSERIDTALAWLDAHAQEPTP